MEQLVLRLFKLIVQVDIHSMVQLVFYKVKFNAHKEHGMEPVVLSYRMVNVLLILLGMELFVLHLFQLLALKDIHLMEQCAFQ